MTSDKGIFSDSPSGSGDPRIQQLNTIYKTVFEAELHRMCVSASLKHFIMRKKTIIGLFIIVLSCSPSNGSNGKNKRKGVPFEDCGE